MWHDIRFALRTLSRSPGLVITAVLSLALGIGANTSIFSLLYQVILRSVPVKNPAALVRLDSDKYSFGWTRSDNSHAMFSYLMYRELRDGNHVLDSLTGRANFPANLAFHGRAISAKAEVVTGNFFEVLGLQPALGRLLTPDDDGVPGRNPVVVLAYNYWSGALGSNPAVLNDTILMNGHPMLVVGVAPAEFRGLVAGQSPDFYTTVSTMSMVSPGWESSEKPDAYWLSLLGRVKAGVTGRQASAELTSLFRTVIAEQMKQFKGLTQEGSKRLLNKPVLVETAAQGINELRDQAATPVLVLMVMVSLVLVMACANIANLLIVRATGRQRETAVRLAVGASRWQLVRQVIVESLLLALAGGVIGLVISKNLTQFLLSLMPADATGGWLASELDPRVFAYGLVLSLVTGLLFGVMPALEATRNDVAPGLKEQSLNASATGASARIRKTLVVAQICLSLMLLVGGGLFTESLMNLVAVDPGFRSEHLITFQIDPSLSGYGKDKRTPLFRTLEDRLRSIPGVTGVARAILTPFSGANWGTGVSVPGRKGSREDSSSAENATGPGFFRNIGIPLISGREFDERDQSNSPKVAILNEALARHLFNTLDVVGRIVVTGPDDTPLRVVGVVKNSKYGSVREQPQRFLYIPCAQGDDRFLSLASFFLRTGGDEHAVMQSVRQIVREIDPNLPVNELNSMQELIGNNISTDRLTATLASAFGVVAALLAAIGLYGVISFSVAKRTREFGIRLALGAAPGSILGTVMREIGLLVAAGILLGLPLSYGLARVVESQFFGIKASDPVVLLLATALMVAVAFLSGWLPAFRAMRIEPVRALRYE
jgi:putative ABC transport system permease protein